MKHKLLFSVFIIFFIFVFIALGTWQIIRLNWKNNLILEIENSLKNPPVELTQSNKQNYLKIKTSGNIDFEKIIRALNDIKYMGPLSVEWEDGAMDREFGATESCSYVKNIDFPPSDIVFDAQFAENSEN